MKNENVGVSRNAVLCTWKVISSENAENTVTGGGGV